MLEKGSGPYSSNGAFLASRDSGPNKKASGTASEPNVTINCRLRTNTISSVGEELCDGDPIRGNQVENNSFHYQLIQVTEPVNDLTFFNNAQQDKENGDLLYYGWPEIENFEDVDKMFRSCDSTFGLGIDNEDELSWFSSSHAIEESNDALKPDFIFPGPDSNTLNDASDCDEILRLNDADCVIDETYERDATVCWNSSSETPGANKTAVVMNSSFENGSETTQIEAGEQLDVKTKLCIRDSLYRLAKSAEQRHKCAKLTTGGQGDGDESRVLASDDTDKCTGFMEIETDTNPIDRSVAHLLFHRPSDLSVVAAIDTIPDSTDQYPCVEKPVSEESSKPLLNNELSRT